MDNTVKVIIAGSRDFNDMDLLISKMDKILSNIKSTIEIVSGGAKGADLLGEAYATLRGHELTVMEADWDKHGRSAGYKRNEQMAAYASHCVIFWDGKSKGSAHMYQIAKRKGMKLRLINYKETPHG